MRTLRLACSVALALVLSSCVMTRDETGETKLDLAALHEHVDAAEFTLGDLALAFQDSDPELASKLNVAHALVTVIDSRIEAALASGEPLDIEEAVNLFLAGTQDLVNVVTSDPEKQAQVRLVVVAVRAILIQVRIAAGQ